MGRAELCLCSHETRTHDVLSQWTLGVSLCGGAHSHVHSYSVAVRRLLLTDIEILSVKQNVSWVVCLFVTVADVGGKWLHLCGHCTAHRKQRVTWLECTGLRRSLLSSVWLIYDPVSSKTSCFKKRIRECVKLDSLFRYCSQLTDGYCMVVVC